MLPQTFTDLLGKLKGVDISRIEKAYTFASKAHKGQKRKSGEDYIVHPLWIAEKLCELKADETTIIAALLHDTVEDTDVTFEELKEEFGDDVYKLVYGLTKLSKLSYQGRIKDWKNDSFFRMMLSSTKDLRVIFIKLVDRWHNMITIDYLSPAKKERIAQETMDVYVPFADLLGAWKVMANLEELSFKALHSEDYEKISALFNSADSKRIYIIEDIKMEIRNKMLKYGIKPDINLLLRRKYSAFLKLKNFSIDPREVDIYTGLEIVVENKEDCYRALSFIHESWIPRFDRMKDYIARPKYNGYSAFHTSVMLENGLLCDFHIMSRAMKDRAELGFFSTVARKKTFSEVINEISQLQQNTSDKKIFYDRLINDILQKRIHVLTSGGEIVNLAEKSCPIDMAYKVYDTQGHHTSMAIVNNKKVPLSHTLSDGDMVEVMFDNEVWPTLEWLKWAKSTTAKTHIKHYLSNSSEMKVYEMGKEYFIRKLYRFGYFDFEKVKNKIEKYIEKNHIGSMKQFFMLIGKEDLLPKKIILEIFGEKELLFSEISLRFPYIKDDYAIMLRVECDDKVGLLNEIIKTIAKNGVNILESMASKQGTNKFVCDFGVQIPDIETFSELCNDLESIEFVNRVYKYN